MIAIAPARVGSNDAFPPRAEYVAARRVHVGAKSVWRNRAGIRTVIVGRETPTRAVTAPRFHISLPVRARLIPTVLDIDPFHGAHRSAGPIRREAQTGPRCAARCGTPDSQMAGKRRPRSHGAPGRADVPHPKGRAIFVASGVARACGARTAAQRAPAGRQKAPR